MKLYLPWVAEFGSELLKHVPMIYADKEEKIVCYEEGKDCLYPNAEHRHTIPRINESIRNTAVSLNQDEIWSAIKEQYGPGYQYITPSTAYNIRTAQFFVPETRDYDFETDVVVFPRWRHTCVRKNWDKWPGLIEMIQAEGHRVFSGGAGDMSFKAKCPAAKDYDNELEASIWAIKHSKLRIGINSALPILSLMCGMKPWILTNEQTAHCIQNRPGDFINWTYYYAADHLTVRWKILPYLEEPKKIIREVNEWMLSVP